MAWDASADPWVWALVAAVLLVLVVVGRLVRGRNRRRQALSRQAAVRAQLAATPARPAKELVDLALRQREEAIVERRRKLEAAGLEAAREPRAPARAPAPLPPRRMLVIEDPPIEIPQPSSEPEINPVQKMALEQWEDVNVVRPASTPKAAPLRSAGNESLEFTKRPGSKKEAEDSVLDADWGDIEVRRDVKKRDTER